MYGKQQECTPIPDPNETPNPADNPWGLQTCNEMTIPFSQSEYNTMFLDEVWNADVDTQNCLQWFGLKPQYTWAIDTFGGRNVKKDFYYASNIIFTNGDLDPWSTGGVTTNINNNIYVKVIKGGAHHLDLRSPNDLDPQDVTDTRAEVTELINQWIATWRLQLAPSTFLASE